MEVIRPAVCLALENKHFAGQNLCCYADARRKFVLESEDYVKWDQKNRGGGVAALRVAVEGCSPLS